MLRCQEPFIVAQALLMALSERYSLFQNYVCLLVCCGVQSMESDAGQLT